MENLMPKVAELLGVGIGEEFELKHIPYLFKVTEEGVRRREADGKWYPAGLFDGLFTGEYEIIKKTWKPKDGHRFYYITFYGNLLEDYYECDNTRDITLYKTGNCFKTRDEITPEIIDKFVKFYKDDTQKFNVLEE